MMKNIMSTTAFIAVMLTSYSIAVSNWTTAFYFVSLLGLTYTFKQFLNSTVKHQNRFSCGLALIVFNFSFALYALVIEPVWGLWCISLSMVTTMVGGILMLKGYSDDSPSVK